MDEAQHYYPILQNEGTLEVEMYCLNEQCVERVDTEDLQHPFTLAFDIEHGIVMVPAEVVSDCGYEPSDEQVDEAIRAAVDAYSQAGVAGNGSKTSVSTQQLTIDKAELYMSMIGSDLKQTSKTELLKLLPELRVMQGFDQNNVHHPEGDLWVHTTQTVSRIQQISNDPDLLWVALLHDIGKVECNWVGDDGRTHYYRNLDLGFEGGHEEYSAQMARNILRRCNMPPERASRIIHLVREHGFTYPETVAGARRAVARIGTEHLQTLLVFHQADYEGDPAIIASKIAAVQELIADVYTPAKGNRPVRLVMQTSALFALHPGHGKNKWIAKTVKWLREEVRSGNVANEHHALLAHAAASPYLPVKMPQVDAA